MVKRANATAEVTHLRMMDAAMDAQAIIDLHIELDPVVKDLRKLIVDQRSVSDADDARSVADRLIEAVDLYRKLAEKGNHEVFVDHTWKPAVGERGPSK